MGLVKTSIFRGGLLRGIVTRKGDRLFYSGPQPDSIRRMIKKLAELDGVSELEMYERLPDRLHGYWSALRDDAQKDRER